LWAVIEVQVGLEPIIQTASSHLLPLADRIVALVGTYHGRISIDRTDAAENGRPCSLTFSVCKDTYETTKTACRYYILGVVQGVAFGDGTAIMSNGHSTEKKANSFLSSCRHLPEGNGRGVCSLYQCGYSKISGRPEATASERLDDYRVTLGGSEFDCGLRKVDDIVASRGGIPLIEDNKIIGAIGC
jgi:hypothetical protein